MEEQAEQGVTTHDRNERQQMETDSQHKTETSTTNRQNIDWFEERQMKI